MSSLIRISAVLREPELVVERAQLLVRRLQLLFRGLQLLVRAAQLLVARLRFLRRGRGFVGQMLAIVDGGGQRVPQAVDSPSALAADSPCASPARRVLWNTIQQRSWPGGRRAVRNHLERDAAAIVAVDHEDVFAASTMRLFAERAADRRAAARPAPRDAGCRRKRLSETSPGSSARNGATSPRMRVISICSLIEHTARSEMRGEEGVVVVAVAACRAPRGAAWQALRRRLACSARGTTSNVASAPGTPSACDRSAASSRRR